MSKTNPKPLTLAQCPVCMMTPGVVPFLNIMDAYPANVFQFIITPNGFQRSLNEFWLCEEHYNHYSHRDNNPDTTRNPVEVE